MRMRCWVRDGREPHVTKTMLERVGVRVVAGCLAVLCAAIASLFNSIQPIPYMDEIFHVAQAQNYCHHNFSHWDPMITTLPGL